MTKKNHSLAIFLLLLPGVGYIALFLSAALGMTILQSFGFFSFSAKTEIGLQEWARVLNSETWDSFLYSTKVAFVSAFGGLVLAYPIALYLRKSFIGKTYLNAIMRVPLFVPALVAAFLILNILSFHGIFNEFLLALGILKEPLRLTHDDWGLGVIAIQIWKNLPFLTLILSAALVNIPVDFEHAASNLGANGLAVFRHVIFPLSIPGALTGVILVFIGVFGDYAINVIAGPLYPPSLAIRMYLFGKGFGEWGQAACLAIIIILGSIFFAWLYSKLANLLVGGT
ncbi:MAG TPA: ABC transporter permease subunit [Anaerolineae bacterium]|nr:ABC transporter permease subunit [Anaerolineae bacterium]